MKYRRLKTVIMISFFVICGIFYCGVRENEPLVMGTQKEAENLLSVTEEELSEFAEETQWKVNINEASKEELMLLEGIGDKISDRILLYREENGDFLQKEDILNVSGIGEKTFENIKNYITVE